MKKLKALLKYATDYKGRYILGIFFLIIVDMLNLIPAKIAGIVTDSISKSYSTPSYLLKWLVLLLFVAIGVAVGRFIWRMLIVGTSRKVEYDLRSKYFAHLQKLSTNFYNKNKTGDLMALATNDLQSIVQSLGFGLVALIDSIFMSSLTIIILLSINVKLTLICLIPLPFIALASNKFGKKIHRRYLKVQESFASLTDCVQENFSGIRIVKSFVQEEKEFLKFQKQNIKNYEENMSYMRIFGVFSPFIETLASLSWIVVIAFGGYFVISSQITIGEFISVNMYLGQLIWPMMAIGFVINTIQRGFASLQRLEEVLKEEPEIKDIDTVDVPSLKGNIEFKNVTFTYPENTVPALKDINISIHQGKTLGVFGRTGSGKSTLVNLLLRLYNIENGTILINGIPINKIPLKTLRENIGFVSDPFLFSDTISNNINLAFDELNMEEVIKASKNSDVYDNIIEFPKGFDTEVGERGVSLSGGQKQRISISRALIKDPEILILDDCLSAVDAKTEVKILENLNEIMKNKTSIIISHRISAIENADDIIVLDEGNIVEQGSHKELIAMNGLYQSIYEKQLLEKKIEEEGEK